MWVVLYPLLSAIDYVGGIPYDVLKPVIDRATAAQLYNLEDYNPVCLSCSLSHALTCTHTYTHTHTHSLTHARAHTHTHTHSCMHTHTHTHSHAQGSGEERDCTVCLSFCSIHQPVCLFQYTSLSVCFSTLGLSWCFSTSAHLSLLFQYISLSVLSISIHQPVRLSASVHQPFCLFQYISQSISLFQYISQSLSLIHI